MVSWLLVIGNRLRQGSLSKVSLTELVNGTTERAYYYATDND